MLSVPVEVVALSILPAVLWGLNPIFDKRGMAAGGDSVQGSLVMVVVSSAIFLSVVALFYGFDGYSSLSIDILVAFVFAGIFGTALGRIAIFVGIHKVGASLNNAVLSTRPLFATLIALAFLGEPLGPLTAVGIVVLVAGVALLAVSKGGDLTGWMPRHLLWSMGAAAMFAAANVARRYGFVESAITPVEAVALNEFAGLAMLATYIAARGRTDVFTRPPRTYLYFAGSGVLTAGAVLSMMVALSLDAGRVAIVDPLTATAPLFTLVAASVFLREFERVTRGVVAGAALIVLGAVLITV